MRNTMSLLGAGMAVVAVAGSARGQQGFQNSAAAQPSTGTLLVRQTYEFMSYGDDPTGLEREIEQVEIDTQIAYGLTKDLTVTAIVPAYWREVDSPGAGVSSEDFELGDAQVVMKYRFWQRDTGPIDTMRASVLAGLDVPTGSGGVSNGGWDPMLGVVFTSIQGRHGVNAGGRYQWNTREKGGAAVMVEDGIEDTLFADFSYLFRVSPAEYGETTHGALYAMVEMSFTYETNGDRELLAAPGVMYEARNWVVEATVQLPVWQDLEERPELEVALGVGVRVFF